ncbi:MAG: hypothetical protein WCF19_05190 [Chlamydiales bacterium]
MKNLLGDHQMTIQLFDGLDGIVKHLKGVREPVGRKRSDLVNRTLLALIEKGSEPCFLLPAVLQFIERVDEAGILQHYTFTSFEIWLNQYSGLSFEENYAVRAKIAGKRVERSDYQALFPIGMGKVYEGTHFVTAHKSPDLDTTIASFWGWLDAFAARVSHGIHVWNLPDGPPPSQIEIDWIFRDLFGAAVFTHLPKTRTLLNLTGNDLMSQQGMQIKTLQDSIGEIDHGQSVDAVLVVDENGFFLGDWRFTDVEGVRQVIISLSSCLRWFENSLHLQLISVFANEKIDVTDIQNALQRLLTLKLEDAEPTLEFSPKQKGHVDLFMKQVLEMKKGLGSDFEEFATVLSALGEIPFGGVDGLIARMKQAELFDARGHLIDMRPRIFAFLEGAIQSLHQGIVKIRARLERLDIALKTKYQVFGKHLNAVTNRSDVEEIKNKMGSYSYLTVVYPDGDKLYPVGVIHASELRRATLGTVSLRDFCNRDEMGIPPYLDVISVIDHHKSALNTFAPPVAILSDVQSSNTLVAQKAFEINDGGRRKPSFIHKEREFIEYLHFLYGIIDDTDLLSKASAMDVQCVAALLNRMKTLAAGKKSVVVSLDDLPRDRNFPQKGAERILQNEEMYSLYRKVYQYREKEVEKNIRLCAKGEPSNFFADTKEQNGCCRVGQTKLFASNIGQFEEHAGNIRRVWLDRALKTAQEKPEIDLHIHMVSTIVNAEEVYKGTVGKYSHSDELWLWIPNQEIAVEHLKRFLNAFQSSPGLKNNPLRVELTGPNADEFALIFKESFLEVPQKKLKQNLPLAVLKYRAGSLNSRKAMVSPFLPRREV